MFMSRAYQIQESIASTSDVDMAWFAAWLCADGCIGGAVTRKAGYRDRYLVSLKFTLTDRDPLDRMAELFGNKVAGPYAQHEGALGTKPLWYWGISGRKAVLLLRRADPWLSIRYRTRAHTVIASWEASSPGRKLTPAQVAEIRERLRTGTHGIGKLLAAEYGVTDGLISAIKTGRR